MVNLRYTLVSDGSSDILLRPALTWLLREAGISGEIRDCWADFRRLRNPPKSLDQKIAKAVELYPCELLFIHRDSERESRHKRCCEIYQAFKKISEPGRFPPRICVIPVRMQEAWLLFDEQAIRKASGNPNGTIRLKLPALNYLERIPNPKAELHQALKTASGLKGRRLKKIPVRQKAHLLGDYISDFSPLLALSAFVSLKNDLAMIIAQEGWAS